MANKSRWIKTTNGWAGRKGYIIPAKDDSILKYNLFFYGCDEFISSNKVGELKKVADAE